VLADPAQALADRGLQAGVDERDRPVTDVRAQQFHIGSAAAHDEVVRALLVVVDEVVDDVPGAVAEAQDELRVPEVRVQAHDVPEQRPVTDHLHRLGHVIDVAAHAHPVSTTEEHDLHLVPSQPRTGERATTPGDRPQAEDQR
jgi:hypothetical protein